MKLLENISIVWSQPGGCRDVLRVSLPLVASTASHTVMLFTDRLFLGRYSVDAIAASTPAGLLSFMFTCFFAGVVGFANTLIAQSVGAGERSNVARALWQAIYFALAAGLILAGISFFGGFFFRWAGHAPQIQAQEKIYFSILMQGAVLMLLHDALACFFSGQGLTRPIMFVNIAGVIVNIPLNYVLIYGVGVFPELGIAGSAIATVFAHFFMLFLFALMIFSRRNIHDYGLWRRKAFDRSMFTKLLKYGAPAGIQFFIDIFAFTYFLMIVGRIGRDELAATNIAFALNSLAFMPMIGFSIATSSLVGQAIGRGQPGDGVVATRSALYMTLSYMWLVACLFIFFPGTFCGIFQSAGEESAPAVQKMAVILLRFVAFYSLLDGLNIIYSGALKGAGDTAFIGWTILSLSVFLVILPITLAVFVFHAGLYTAWSLATLYVCVLAVAFWWRFRQGKWKLIKVLEPYPAAAEIVMPRPGIPGAEEL